MIEFDNATEVARDLDMKTLKEQIDDFTSQTKANPGMKVFIEKTEQPNVREILERCLADADQTENIVVLRFNLDKENEKCESVTGTTIISVAGRHGALQAMEILNKT